MKYLKIIRESDYTIHELTSQRVRAGRVFRSFFTVVMLSSVLILSSCAVGVRTPRHYSSGIVIQSHTRVERPRRVRHIRVERHHHKDHHKKDRHDRGRWRND